MKSITMWRYRKETLSNSSTTRLICMKVIVLCIMVHESVAFLVIRWVIAAGAAHPHLRLPEFMEAPLFHYATFHPLLLVDHPHFMNSVFFASLEGRLYLNKWIFKVV